MFMRMAMWDANASLEFWLDQPLSDIPMWNQAYKAESDDIKQKIKNG